MSSAIFTARLCNLVGIFPHYAEFAFQLVYFVIEGAFCTTYARAHGSAIMHTLRAEAAWKTLTVTWIECNNFTWWAFAWWNTWRGGVKTNNSVWTCCQRSGYQWHGNASTVLNVQTSTVLYDQKKRNIMLDGWTMQYEKRTITSFVKYRRRENGQYLHSAIIIEEKGKKKEKRRNHRVRRFNHAIRKKNHHLVHEISSSREWTILTPCNHHRRKRKKEGKNKETSC